MHTLQDLVEAGDSIVDLEPEEVALLVLKEIADQEKRKGSGAPNRHNFSLRFCNSPQTVQRAIMEGWAWLESSAAITHLPQQDGFFFVTRRGHELLQSCDTAVFTREQILPRHLLHPRIQQKARSAFCAANLIRQCLKHSSKLKSQSGTWAGSRIRISAFRLRGKRFIQRMDGSQTQMLCQRNDKRCLI